MQNSFEHIDMWLAEVGKYTNENPLKLLVGSRIDLKEQRIVTTEMGRDLAQKIGVDFIETSSKEGQFYLADARICVILCVFPVGDARTCWFWVLCVALYDPT
jgi:hypothetical protein